MEFFKMMSLDINKYEAFLRNKVRFAESSGFLCDLSEINPALKPHNKLMVKWLVEGGRRACFASFGLHKTVTQLEVVRLTLKHTGGRALIIAPLNVRLEFRRDAVERLGWSEGPKFIRRIEEAGETGIYITNYETIRDGKMDPRLFNVASLDEAVVLKGFGGSKTFREFMRLFTGDAGPKGDRRGTTCVPYRFVATATPSPNEYIELLAYADFLGIMDTSQAKTRFFKRDSTKADKLTLHPHKEEEFWLWVASWALFVTKPSDLTGNTQDDQGYEMPELDIRWHELPVDHSDALPNKKGEYVLFREANLGVQQAAKEKRDSLKARIAKMMELRDEDLSAHRIIWHDRDDERDAIAKAIKGIPVITGGPNLEEREKNIMDFSDGLIQELAAKPVIAGSGSNFQRHCHWAIYIGIGFKFGEFIQSVHRLQRFLQQHRVRIDLIYTEAERSVRQSLERKWEQDKKLRNKMTQIMKDYGLAEIALAKNLIRKMGVERVEIRGQNYKMVQHDAVLEAAAMKKNSVGLILTSIPFSTQYEYSPNYSDFGHSENNHEFWRQMDFLTPSLVDILMPGRICAIHVKDRIIPGGMTGLGYQTVYPFHLDAIEHYTTCPECRIRIAIAKARGKRPRPCHHRFEYIGMKTIVTDVVRENNQTYRLGWTEQCKDGSKMGVGMPEYLLLFRKTPSDNSDAYADIPVFKQKPMQRLQDGSTRKFINKTKDPIVPGTGYSRARWQLDAHGFTRSAGDRLLSPEELVELEHKHIFRIFRDFNFNTIYDFEHHVRIGEALEEKGKLPVTFMLLQPQSWSNEVWTDITRMLTLNSSQKQKGKEMHLCPMQIDIARRVIRQMSNPGDIVHDPFAGIGTVPSIAVQEGRFGSGTELKYSYFIDGANYCRAAEQKIEMPGLFDAEGIDADLPDELNEEVA
jgi:DNA modification methylase